MDPEHCLAVFCSEIGQMQKLLSPMVFSSSEDIRVCAGNTPGYPPGGYSANSTPSHMTPGYVGFPSNTPVYTGIYF
jgi:hypothetical protein